MVYPVTPSATDDIDFEKHQAVRVALEKLNPQDSQILNLRFGRELSWDEIPPYLKHDGKPPSTSAARKRGSRALQRLRDLVLSSLEDPSNL